MIVRKVFSSQGQWCLFLVSVNIKTNASEEISTSAVSENGPYNPLDWTGIVSGSFS